MQNKTIAQTAKELLALKATKPTNKKSTPRVFSADEIKILTILAADKPQNLRTLFYRPQTGSLQNLMRFFPIFQNGQQDYIDLVNQYFPTALYDFLIADKLRPEYSASSRFNRMTTPAVQWPINSLNAINQKLKKLCQNDNFANNLLDRHNHLSHKMPESRLKFTISLSTLPRQVLTDYTQKNDAEKNKPGRNIVLFLFGYGAIYRTLYGKTNDLLANDITQLPKVPPLNLAGQQLMGRISQPAQQSPVQGTTIQPSIGDNNDTQTPAGSRRSDPPIPFTPTILNSAAKPTVYSPTLLNSGSKLNTHSSYESNTTVTTFYVPPELQQQTNSGPC